MDENKTQYIRISESGVYIQTGEGEGKTRIAIRGMALSKEKLFSYFRNEIEEGLEKKSIGFLQSPAKEGYVYVFGSPGKTSDFWLVREERDPKVMKAENEAAYREEWFERNKDILHAAILALEEGGKAMDKNAPLELVCPETKRSEGERIVEWLVSEGFKNAALKGEAEYIEELVFSSPFRIEDSREDTIQVVLVVDCLEIRAFDRKTKEEAATLSSRGELEIPLPVPPCVTVSDWVEPKAKRLGEEIAKLSRAYAEEAEEQRFEVHLVPASLFCVKSTEAMFEGATEFLYGEEGEEEEDDGVSCSFSIYSNTEAW